MIHKKILKRSHSNGDFFAGGSFRPHFCSFTQPMLFMCPILRDVIKFNSIANEFNSIGPVQSFNSIQSEQFNQVQSGPKKKISSAPSAPIKFNRLSQKSRKVQSIVDQFKRSIQFNSIQCSIQPWLGVLGV